MNDIISWGIFWEKKMEEKVKRLVKFSFTFQVLDMLQL